MSFTDLLLLIRVFFKVGLTSFGGHAALVAVVQREMVEEKQLIEEKVILNALSIASVLPGPLAVNVVTYLGYKIAGWLGALVSLASVLIPPFFMMIGLALVYSKYGSVGDINIFLEGVVAVIVGLIASVCYRLFKNNVKSTWQIVLSILVAFLSFYFNSYLWIIVFIVAGGCIGVIADRIFRINDRSEDDKVISLTIGKSFWIGLVCFVSGLVLLLFVTKGIYSDLFREFSKVSLTLFGGGYVMIPILHDIIVERHSWLSGEEFALAISFGQITPGPILVSATYVGYQLAGFAGALLATLGIFVPSALLMVVVGSVFDKFQEKNLLSAIMAGVRPVVIALIFYSTWLLGGAENITAFTIIVAIGAFVSITFLKVNYLLVIPVGGLISLTISYL